jgi:predicted enzyme related to lactoylglutathione lyase
MGNLSMKTILERVIILVNDYDEAFVFYQKAFMCEKLFDATIS